ncbi:MAG: thioredoxin reductase [Halovenus sp.]
MPGIDRHDVVVVGGGIAGESILRRNAHVENFPGFPAGVNPRQLLALMGEQAETAGCEQVQATVDRVERLKDGFGVDTVGGVGIVDTDEPGRTRVEGLYAAGRLAEKPHQAVVCAGHGAEVAVTLLEDDDRPFYHDWVAPEGYFTDRGREARSLDVLRDRFAEPHPGEQVTHPSLEE